MEVLKRSMTIGSNPIQLSTADTAMPVECVMYSGVKLAGPRQQTRAVELDYWTTNLPTFRLTSTVSITTEPPKICVLYYFGKSYKVYCLPKN